MTFELTPEEKMLSGILHDVQTNDRYTDHEKLLISLYLIVKYGDVTAGLIRRSGEQFTRSLRAIMERSEYES